MNKVNEIEVLDPKEAANFLKISLKSLQNMASDGKIPYYKLGGRNRFIKEELVKVLQCDPRGIRDDD